MSREEMIRGLKKGMLDRVAVIQNLKKGMESELRKLIKAREAQAKDRPEKENSQDPLDQAQYAVAVWSYTCALEQKEERIKRLVIAVNSINRGEYGNCADCEDEISLERVMAMPMARRCISCQERIE